MFLALFLLALVAVSLVVVSLVVADKEEIPPPRNIRTRPRPPSPTDLNTIVDRLNEAIPCLMFQVDPNDNAIIVCRALDQLFDRSDREVITPAMDDLMRQIRREIGRICWQIPNWYEDPIYWDDLKETFDIHPQRICPESIKTL